MFVVLAMLATPIGVAGAGWCVRTSVLREYLLRFQEFC